LASFGAFSIFKAKNIRPIEGVPIGKNSHATRMEIALLRPWRQRTWRSSASAKHQPALAAAPALVEQARADAA
jgi:hypothetical protein